MLFHTGLQDSSRAGLRSDRRITHSSKASRRVMVFDIAEITVTSAVGDAQSAFHCSKEAKPCSDSVQELILTELH